MNPLYNGISLTVLDNLKFSFDTYPYQDNAIVNFDNFAGTGIFSKIYSIKKQKGCIKMGRATFLQPRKKQNTLFNTVLVTTCDLYFLLFTFFSGFACGNTTFRF